MVAGSSDRVLVDGVMVRGVEVDPLTRCSHYDTERDVLAIAFVCCETFYPCYRCHEAVADHEPEVWPVEARDEPALLCGACGHTFTIATYLDSPTACPACDTGFNPGCAAHHNRYFEG